MALFATLLASIGLDTSGWVAGAKTVKNEQNKTEADTRSWFRRMNDEAKKSYGKSSDLGQALKLMAGKGAIGALSGVASELKNFTANIADMSAAMKKGEANWGDFTEGLIKSLPVIGQAWEAGKNLKEIFTHEQHDLDADAKDAKEFNEKMDKKLAAIKEAKLFSQELSKELAKTQQGAYLDSITNDFDRKIEEAKFKAQDELSDLHNRVAEQLKNSNEKRAQILKQQAEVEKAIEQKKQNDIMAINRDRADKEQKDRDEENKKREEQNKQQLEKFQEQLKQKAQAEKDVLENKKRELEEGLKRDNYRGPVSTNAVRGGAQFVQYAPNLASRFTPAEQQQIAQLKGINEKLAALNKQKIEDKETLIASLN